MTFRQRQRRSNIFVVVDWGVQVSGGLGAVQGQSPGGGLGQSPQKQNLSFKFTKRRKAILLFFGIGLHVSMRSYFVRVTYVKTKYMQCMQCDIMSVCFRAHVLLTDA